MKKKTLLHKIIPASVLTIALGLGTFGVVACGTDSQTTATAAGPNSGEMGNPPGDPPNGEMGTPPDGGGTVSVDGGTYTSNGVGSPAIYSTADILVKNATLVSNKSEGVCIEGINTIDLTNCTLTANNTEKNSNAQYLDTIMIYQSMSGDASGTDSSFTMTGGTLNSKSGHVFHVTNTSAVINLNNVTINNTDSDGVLLSVVNDGWKGASNTATLNATSQNLEGKIIVSNTASSASNSESKLTMKLDSNSSFTGMIGDENGIHLRITGWQHF